MNRRWRNQESFRVVTANVAAIDAVANTGSSTPVKPLAEPSKPRRMGLMRRMMRQASGRFSSNKHESHSSNNSNQSLQGFDPNHNNNNNNNSKNFKDDTLADSATQATSADSPLHDSDSSEPYDSSFEPAPPAFHMPPPALGVVARQQHEAEREAIVEETYVEDLPMPPPSSSPMLNRQLEMEPQQPPAFQDHGHNPYNPTRFPDRDSLRLEEEDEDVSDDMYYNPQPYNNHHQSPVRETPRLAGFRQDPLAPPLQLQHEVRERDYDPSPYACAAQSPPAPLMQPRAAAASMPGAFASKYAPIIAKTQDYNPPRSYEAERGRGVDDYYNQARRYNEDPYYPPAAPAAVPPVSAGGLSGPYDTNRSMPPLQFNSNIASSPSKTIEIAPGCFVPLRGADETWRCIENDFYTPCLCFGCSTEICCISDADYVLCPSCRVVSPMDTQTGDGGCGLGFTYDDLMRWQTEIVQRQEQQQRPGSRYY